MPREPSADALEALEDAAELHGELLDCAELTNERDALWAEAHDGGVTYETISERCGGAGNDASIHTVRLHVKRYAGAGWAKVPKKKRRRR